MQNYYLKKEKLIADLQALQAQGQTIALQKDSSNLFRALRKKGQGLDVRQFNEVLSVDPERMIANVEGMTTYERLCDACLPFHCMPAVVPQLKTITVGGALTGIGIESSSFKYGLMHETVTAFEVLLPDGSVVLCTADNDHSDLFFAFPNSYGTLGYALRLELALCPIKPFVKLSHHKFTESEACFKALKSFCIEGRKEGSFDFIDGVVFSEKEYYISTGKLVAEAPYQSDYSFRHIYYRSIQKRKEDYLSIYDYIWRWDTDWFWCSKVFYAENPLMRLLLGKKRLNSSYYGKLRQFFANNKVAQYFYAMLNKKWEAVIQDVQIPVEAAEEFTHFFKDNIAIYPIWLCPTIPYRPEVCFDLYALKPEQLYVNFGFWDKIKKQQSDGHYNRLIEKKVSALSGKKSLYSESYYTKTEFDALYNQKTYAILKNKYDPEKRLLSLYHKCCEK